MKSPGSLFVPLVSEERLSTTFRHVLSSGGHAHARELLNDTFAKMPRPDGNFVRDFQTTGFDARVWELYLLAWARAAGFDVKRPFDRPDFLLEKGEGRVWIEAVTAHHTIRTEADALAPPPAPALGGAKGYEDFVPIRLAGALSSKLRARYWDLDHLREQPLVFAIADFHDPSPLRDTSAPLRTYLYGEASTVLSQRGEPIVHKGRPVTEHRLGSKVIPSGFFSQAGAEHVSGVLFSNAGTVSKFNRIAHQENPSPNTVLIRGGWALDERPEAFVSKAFAYIVGRAPNRETWEEGLEIFHNPRALHPLPTHLLNVPVTHVMERGEVNTYFRGEFIPMMSVTAVVHSAEGPVESEAWRPVMEAMRLRFQLVADAATDEIWEGLSGARTPS